MEGKACTLHPWLKRMIVKSGKSLHVTCDDANLNPLKQPL